MKTVVLGPRPAELEALLERRRACGQDLFDEAWEGVLHLAPAPNARHSLVAEELAAALREPARRAGLRGSGPFNLGTSVDYRVPDGGYHRGVPTGVWLPTAAIVVEVLSPDDETYQKFDFYFRRGVDEIVVAEPVEKALRWWVRHGEGYAPADSSALLGVGVAEIARRIDWP